jgi:hypothetical protein
MGRKSLIVGLLAGICLGLVELLFLYLAIQKIEIPEYRAHFIRNYFLQAIFIRFPLIAVLFFTVVFFAKINPAGLIIGFGFSVIMCGVTGLYKMRQAVTGNI